jgi:hypothetical protein
VEHDLFGKPVSTFPDHALSGKPARWARKGRVPSIRDRSAEPPPGSGRNSAPRFSHAPRQKPWEQAMPRKPGLNSEFVMFDVVYEDGSQRSNRKVPRTLTGGIDGDKPAHEFLIEQDRDIAEKSGRPVLKIKSIARAGAKKKDRNYSERRPD